MYYYIVEPVTTASEQKRIEQIKLILSKLGIAGEFVIASPTKSVEERLRLALRRGFTTIVAIGSDILANEVASSLLTYSDERASLGVIPSDPHQTLWQMVGAQSLNQITDLLRERSTTSIDAISLTNHRAFITEATISLNQPVHFQIAYERVFIEGLLNRLTVQPDNLVTLANEANVNPKSTPFLNRLFGKVESPGQAMITRFQTPLWQLTTEQPCSLLIAGQPWAETPLAFAHRPKALKLIVDRAKITTEKETYRKES